VAKLVVGAVWLLCLVAFFLPDTSALALPGRRLFYGLLIVHAIECLVFLPRLRAAGGSLARHLVQTLLFGLFHVRTLGSPA